MNPISSVSSNLEFIITHVDHLEDNVFDAKNKVFIPLEDKRDLETKYKSADFVKGSDIFSSYQTFIEENSDNFSPDKLRILDLSLENRISHLKGQLTGVTGFFRTLFFAHWTDETISTFQQLEMLDQYLKGKIQHPTSVPVEEPEGKIDRLNKIPIAMQAPLALLEEPLNEASSEVSSDDEYLDASSEQDKSVIASPPITVSEEQTAPVKQKEPTQQNVETSKAPPPPPPLLKAKISEAKIPQEPANEPPFNKNVDNHKSPMQIAKEMIAIQRYATDLEPALKSARNDLKELQALNAKLEESKIRLTDAQGELKGREDALKFLRTAKRENGIVWQMKVNKRTGEKKKVPFYEIEKFEQRNAERKNRNMPPLSNKYRIDNAISLNQTVIADLKTNVQREQKEMEEIAKQIKAIEIKYQSAFDKKNLPKLDQKSNLVLLDELLKKKELKLYQWNTAYQNREKFLFEKEKTKVVAQTKQQQKLDPEWDDLKNINPVDAAFFAKRDDIALNLIAPEKYEVDPDLVKKFESQDLQDQTNLQNMSRKRPSS